MLEKLMMKHDSLKISDLNNFLLGLSLIIYSLSIYLVSNPVILIIIYLFTYEIYLHVRSKKYLRFLIDIAGILLIGYLFLNLISLSFFKINILKYIGITIKVLLFLTFFLIVIKCIRMKNIKYIKGQRYNKKYTFKELRSLKFKNFWKNNETLINSYVKENDLNLESDYYKLIKSNINNKTKNDLEEYVWLNYLRFYKNRRYNKKMIFDTLNLVFIIIHVIILILAVVVR